jgi:hypothetical protein
MIVPESYLFVLIVSSSLLVPIGLALRTLLAMKAHVVLPILRLRITNHLTEMKVMETVPTTAVSEGNARSSIHAGRQSW